MSRMIRNLIFMGFVIVAFAACNSLFPTSIGKILSNPRNYAGKEVTISGTVTGTFSIVIIKYFSLRDETGEMIVVTGKPLPNRGDKIKVSGTVEEAFSLGDKSMIVVVDKSGN